MEERLQKILARAGFGSRRACEDLITSGRVRVNGLVAELGNKANPESDQITVDNQSITIEQNFIYIALYKPRGVLSTTKSSDQRLTVRDLINLPDRIYPVGRLDFDSEGLILLTNDGELANRITHPRYGHEKEYRVLVSKRPDDTQINTWRHGVVLEDGFRTSPTQVTFESSYGKGAWLRVILREGRKRQIRQVGATLGLHVVKIIRIRIGNIHVGTLKPKQWRYLSDSEIKALKALEKPTQT